MRSCASSFNPLFFFGGSHCRGGCCRKAGVNVWWSWDCKATSTRTPKSQYVLRSGIWVLQRNGGPFCISCKSKHKRTQNPRLFDEGGDKDIEASELESIVRPGAFLSHQIHPDFSVGHTYVEYGISTSNAVPKDQNLPTASIHSSSFHHAWSWYDGSATYTLLFWYLGLVKWSHFSRVVGTRSRSRRPPAQDELDRTETETGPWQRQGCLVRESWFVGVQDER